MKTNRISYVRKNTNIFSLKILFFVICIFSIQLSLPVFAQCPAGYSSAQVNWDNQDYFHQNSLYGVTNPATGQPFITTSMMQTQKFALGTNSITINTTITPGGTSPNWGDVSMHTGDAGSYGTGDDIKLMGNGTVTITFQAAVMNAKFSVYDIDYNQKVTVTALNGATALNVVMAKVSGTNLTIAGSGTTSASATAGATNAIANTSSDGTANIDVAGPVTSITLTISQTGTKLSGAAASQEDGGFFLSDITACVADPGFPTNYYASTTQPFTGQPPYFLASSDTNLCIYMINPFTGVADSVFSESATEGRTINSLAYDPVNRWLYYVMDYSPLGSPYNRKLKKYDFNTETISTVVSDLNTLGIATYTWGVETAAAAFYNGALYIGIEGTDNAYTGAWESTLWRIDFDGSGNAIRASQAYGFPSGSGGQPGHDWGDFAIKDGILITHGTYNVTPWTSNFIHYNLQNESIVNTYGGYVDTAGQIGQTWNGDIYRIAKSVAIYNMNGTTGSSSPVVATSCSPPWIYRSVDASSAFKPKQDFGDAPASYDPNPLSPAANQQNCNTSKLRLGANWDREWSKTSSANATGDGSDEDGISTVTIMSAIGVAYNHVQQVKVLNNTGANATLGGWLDYNGNGVFDASEGVIVTVSSSASMQTISLQWTNITVPVGAANTFLRVRLVSGTGTLTSASATGWFNDGETEDYAVVSSGVSLGINLVDFNARVTNSKQVQLDWTADITEGASGFEVQRSADEKNWEKIAWAPVHSNKMSDYYTLLDEQPLTGKSYYRLKLVEYSGSFHFSDTRQVYLDKPGDNMIIYPNPAQDKINITINTSMPCRGSVFVRSISGQLFVSNRSIAINSGLNKIPVDISALGAGVYTVELSVNGKQYLNKITVTR